MKERVKRWVLALLAALLFPMVGWAQSLPATPPVNVETAPEQLALMLLEAIGSGNWAMVAVMGVLLAVWLLRKFGAQLVPALGNPKLAPWMALVASIAAAVGTALMAGEVISVALLLKAVVIALAAGGLWSGVKEQAKRAGDEAAAGVVDDASAARVLRGPPQ